MCDFNLYFFLTKLAVIVLLASIITVIVCSDPLAPVQSLKIYSEFAFAVILTDVPSLYSPLSGDIVPPSTGLTDVVKLYLIIISDDSLRYASICEYHNVDHLIRKPYLGCDSAPKQAVIVDTCLNLYENEGYLPNYVISLQANSPDITTSILNKIFAHHTSIGDEVYRETVSINENGDQNGAVRIMNIATVFQNSLSTYLTTFKINLRDVHLKSDV